MDNSTKAELSNLICTENTIQILRPHIQTWIRDQKPTDPLKMSELVDDLLRCLAKQGDDKACLQVCMPMADRTTTISGWTEEVIEQTTEGLGKRTKETSLKWLNRNLNQADFNHRDLDQPCISSNLSWFQSHKTLLSHTQSEDDNVDVDTHGLIQSEALIATTSMSKDTSHKIALLRLFQQSYLFFILPIVLWLLMW